MKKITHYYIASKSCRELLIEDVNISIRKGFQPYGNPYFDGAYHYQAMVAYEE